MKTYVLTRAGMFVRMAEKVVITIARVEGSSQDQNTGDAGRTVSFVEKTNRIPSFKHFVKMKYTANCPYNSKSVIGAYTGAARRRVHIATVRHRPRSGHGPGRRRARHAHIL